MHRQIAGRLTSRVTKWIVLVAWIVILGVSGGFAQKLTNVQDNEASSWLPGSAESTKALDELKPFQDPNDIPTVVVYHRAGGLSAQDLRTIRTQLVSRSCGKADAEPAQGASPKQRPGAIGQKKDDGADRRDAQRRKCCGAAADLIGQTPEQQQRAEIADHIGGINQRQHDAGKTKLLFVDNVKGSEQRTAGKQDADHGGHRHDGHAFFCLRVVCSIDCQKRHCLLPFRDAVMGMRAQTIQPVRGSANTTRFPSGSPSRMRFTWLPCSVSAGLSADNSWQLRAFRGAGRFLHVSGC